MAYAFALLRVQVTPAAAERQERPRLVSEEASYPLNFHFLPYARSCIFLCHMKHFPDYRTHANIISQYTLR